MNQVVKVLNLNAIVTTPLMINNRAVGLLDMGSRSSFSASDIRRIENLAGQLALIISNKLTEASLRISQENLSAVIENNNGSIWSVDRNCRILTLNSYFRNDFNEAFGIELEVGSNAIDHLPEELAKIWDERYARVFGGEQFVVEDKYNVKGELRYFEVAMNPIRHGNQVTGASVFASDITEKKRAAQALMMSEERVRAFVGALPDTAFILDKEGRFIEILSNSLGRHTIPKEALLNRLAEEVLPGSTGTAIKEVISETMETGQTQTVVYSYEMGNTPRWFEGRTSLVESPEDDRKLVFWISRDITEQKNAENGLTRTMKELRRSNKELEQFAYVASHDLQEPLRKVKNFTDLFAAHFSDLQDEKAVKYISYITDGASRMQTLISDLLSFSRVATHQKPFEKISMGGILDQVVNNLQLSIEESMAEITHDQLPVVEVDGSQMTQVLFNLVSNAIKFRKEDEPPRIHVGCEENTDNWRFSIKDNGIGLDPAYADKIFEVFQRLHAHAEYPGNGIGLALCKKIVERHEGNIWVEAEQNNGTIFHFTIPKKYEKNVDESIQSHQPVTG
jgi:PAS domain S-box-containing protein